MAIPCHGNALQLQAVPSVTYYTRLFNSISFHQLSELRWSKPWLCSSRTQPSSSTWSVSASFVELDTEMVESSGAQRNATEIALELLEWPRVLQIVSSFAGTTSAKELLQEFVIPCTQIECEDLLSKTTAAIDLLALLGSTLDFGGIQTKLVNSCLTRLRKGFVIIGNEALAISTLLQFTNTIQYDVKTSIEENNQTVIALDSYIDTICTIGSQPEILKAISKVIDEDGNVKDTASPELQKARIQYRTLETRVQELLSSMVKEQGVSASIQEVEGRFCIALSADHEETLQGLLLRSGGSTSYVEPVVIVPLNDKLAEARASILKAEYEALRALTNKVMPHVDILSNLLDTIINLDVIVARAKFSLTYKGSRPTFTSHQDKGLAPPPPNLGPHVGILLQLRNAHHPLLLHQFRQQTQKKKRITFGKKKKQDGAPSVLQPVPIDVTVQEQTKIVTITGPNTGGKTAAMKTVGLGVLMAKSGLYVLAADPVYLPWFDAVFADIGDEQSLCQSLSTFSGHLRRITHIKESSTGESLVLLDEVGTGTNPVEGAALGMSILESFAREGRGGARLTLASTHHAELKTLKYSDSRFENASVEFDEETLKPTYRLLWGIPGRSNALNISERLGIPKQILQAAWNYLGAGTAEINQVIMDLEKSKKEFESSIFEAEEYLKESKLLHVRLKGAVERLEDELQSSHVSAYDILQDEAHKARASISAIHKKRLNSVETNASGIRTSTEASISTTLKTTDGKPQAPNAQGGASIPSIGDMVYVPKLKKQATVTQILSGKKMVVVQYGAMQVRLNYSDIQV